MEEDVQRSSAELELHFGIHPNQIQSQIALPGAGSRHLAGDHCRHVDWGRVLRAGACNPAATPNPGLRVVST